MVKPLALGYIQFDPKFGEIEKNIDYIRECIPKVQHADLLVLPELCTSGYTFNDREDAFRYAEPIPGGKTSLALEKLARKYQVYIVAGINEKDSDTLYNSAAFIGPSGYIGKYRKNHLFNTEKTIFAPGNLKFPIFSLGTMKVGILICFYWIFPEAWRTLTLKGADIICHPSNLVLENLAHRALPVTAMINRIFIICSNRIGKEKNLTFIGGSMIVNPKGDILHQASSSKEEYYVTSVNPDDARNKMVTERNDVIGDRRPEIYGL